MSVIFETLKKLKTESTGSGKSIGRRAPNKKVFAFNAARYPFSSVLMLLVVFSVLGAGTLFGYFQLRDRSSKNTEAFLMSSADVRQSPSIHFNAKIENKSKPFLSSGKSSALNSIEYSPPSKNHDDFETKGLNRKIHDNTRFNVTPKATEHSHAASEIQAKPTDKSSTAQKSTLPDVNKVFLSNAKKNANIARLISDIQREMEHGENDRIKTLFDELAMIKGQNNSYVLKLKAVWHIRKQEYEDAASLLRTVLSRNGLDLEAGLNMAIVEINTGKEQNAYRRLEKLQNSYPDNVQLAEILQDLRRLFNGEQIRYLMKHNG